MISFLIHLREIRPPDLSDGDQPEYVQNQIFQVRRKIKIKLYV